MSAMVRAERLQTRADAAAMSAAAALKCCREQRERTEQLQLRMQSTAAAAFQTGETMDSPLDQALCQLDAFQVCEWQEQDLLKQLNTIQRCRGTKSCKCIACWEERARTRKEAADTLKCVAEKAWEYASTESWGSSLESGSQSKANAGAAGSVFRLREARQVTPPAESQAPVFSWSSGEQRATRAQSASAVLRRTQGHPRRPDIKRRRGSNASVCSSVSDVSNASVKSAPAALPSLVPSTSCSPSTLRIPGTAKSFRAVRTKVFLNDDF